MATIRINYANVLRQVATLRELSEEHAAAAAALDAQRAALAVGWSDPAGVAYTAAAMGLAAEMRAAAAQLRSLAMEIGNAAAKVKAQEEANAKAASRLAN